MRIQSQGLAEVGRHLCTASSPMSCSNLVSKGRLPRAFSSWVLNTSKDGDRNLFGLPEPELDHSPAEECLLMLKLISVYAHSFLALGSTEKRLDETSLPTLSGIY